MNDAAVSHIEDIGNLQPGEAHLMELDDRCLHRIGILSGVQKKLARSFSTSLHMDATTALHFVTGK
jgi:hypothetical protein